MAHLDALSSQSLRLKQEIRDKNLFERVFSLLNFMLVDFMVDSTKMFFFVKRNLLKQKREEKRKKLTHRCYSGFMLVSAATAKSETNYLR